MAKERKKSDSEILIQLTELKKDTEYLKERIDKINGCLNDYPIQKEKIKNNGKRLDRIEPLVLNLRIKVYGVATAIGIITGFIGTLIGKFWG